MLRAFPAALTLLLVVACGGSKNAPADPPPLPDQAAAGEGAALGQSGASEEAPAPLTGEDRASVDRMIGLTVQLLDTLSQGEGECDVIASSMNAFLDEHGGEIKSLTERLQNSPQATQAAASHEIEQAIKPKMANLEVALENCEEHEGVIGAFMRLRSL